MRYSLEGSVASEVCPGRPPGILTPFSDVSVNVASHHGICDTPLGISLIMQSPCTAPLMLFELRWDVLPSSTSHNSTKPYFPETVRQPRTDLPDMSEQRIPGAAPGRGLWRIPLRRIPGNSVIFAPCQRRRRSLREDLWSSLHWENCWGSPWRSIWKMFRICGPRVSEKCIWLRNIRSPGTYGGRVALVFTIALIEVFHESLVLGSVLLD